MQLEITQTDKNKWSGFVKWQQALDADSFYSALIEVSECFAA